LVRVVGKRRPVSSAGLLALGVAMFATSASGVPAAYRAAAPEPARVSEPDGAGGNTAPTAEFPAATTTSDRITHAVPAAQGTAGIPMTVLDAYRKAAQRTNLAQPGCHIPVELIAAIGKVESGHARGGRVDAAGTMLEPILGPTLSGGPFAAIGDTDGGELDGDTTWDRAVGPMQFIPGTWARWRADGNADGHADPQNAYDASLAAGGYLCAGGRDLATPAGLDAAVLSYNNSAAYLSLVRSWMSVYQRGTLAVADITGVDPVSAQAAPPRSAKPPADAPQEPSEPPSEEPEEPCAPPDESVDETPEDPSGGPSVRPTSPPTRPTEPTRTRPTEPTRTRSSEPPTRTRVTNPKLPDDLLSGSPGDPPC
jgi:membrane-bound lytic murein transglycosylase B